MNNLDLREKMDNYGEKITLENWGIEVRPFLTLSEIESIITQVLTCKNGIERDKMLISNIIVACTDLYYEGMDFDYEYEQILYSGFWEDLLQACPILRSNIQTIHREVEEVLSTRAVVNTLLDAITNKINNLDIKEINFKAIEESLQSILKTGE